MTDLSAGGSINAPSSPPSSAAAAAASFSFPLPLPPDAWLLLCARFVRLFSYGWCSMALLLYLRALGYSALSIGFLFSATLLGDVVLSFILSSISDSLGRRLTLLIAAGLQVGCGILFAATGNYVALLLAGILGIMSPTGGEMGPFMSVEQVSLAELMNSAQQQLHRPGRMNAAEKGVQLQRWYQSLGFIGQAFGALCSGVALASFSGKAGSDWSSLGGYRLVFGMYAVYAAGLSCLYWALSPAIEALHAREVVIAPRNVLAKMTLSRPESRAAVTKLCLLLMLDALAAGFVLQTVVVFWFFEQFSLSIKTIGLVMLLANLLSGFSALSSSWLVGRFGALTTLLLTHLPSNIFLALLPFMPKAKAAIALLLLRHALSQGEATARQNYVRAMVPAEDLPAASVILSLVRSLAMCITPLFAVWCLEGGAREHPFVFGLPFLLAGLIKIAYDIMLYLSAQKVEGEKEQMGGTGMDGASSSSSSFFSRPSSSYAPISSSAASSSAIATHTVDIDESDLYDEDGLALDASLSEGLEVDRQAADAL